MRYSKAKGRDCRLVIAGPRFERAEGFHQRRLRAENLSGLLLCALIPPLELLPSMATGPCLTIAAFGLAIFLADGLLALAALGLGAGSIGLILTVLL